VKADVWCISDIEVRKRGYQTGARTLVVHAVNDMCWMLEISVF